MKDLIKFPQGKDWENTGEGGLAVFFVLLASQDRKKRRQKCIAGDILWSSMDVTLAPDKLKKLEDELRERDKDKTYDLAKHVLEIDLGMMIASTKEALWNEKKGFYFCAEEKDLTQTGQKLFELLTEIYGEKPLIVTLLDT